MLNPLILALSVSTPVAAPQQAAPPMACRPNALDKVQRQRQQALLATVIRRADAKQGLPDGLALRFPPDAALFLELAEWISLERRCCPFLDFALDWKGDNTVSVRLTGQPGVKEFIAGEMGIASDR